MIYVRSKGLNYTLYSHTGATEINQIHKKKPKKLQFFSIKLRESK